MNTVRAIVAVIAGYLLGGFLPAEYVARARGIDIRSVGTRNPGLTNVFLEVGVVPGIITASYDLAVGVGVILLAGHLGVSPGWSYAAGLATIVGHRWPLLSGGRGGEGVGAATGMLLYGIGIALTEGWLSQPELWLLGAIAGAVAIATGKATVVGVTVLPPLLGQVILAMPPLEFGLFFSTLAVFIWTRQVMIACPECLFRLAEPVRARIERFR